MAIPVERGMMKTFFGGAVLGFYGMSFGRSMRAFRDFHGRSGLIRR